LLPDIDIEKMQLKSAPVFREGEGFHNSLRWIAMMHKNVSCSLSATSGVVTGSDVIKQLLAGADTVQVATALYNNGIGHIKTIHDELRAWMERHKYSKIEEFKGKMSFDNIENPETYLRIQFMKHFAGIE
jgi:dihydroorotate dehydrogenase (fumarate)